MYDLSSVMFYNTKFRIRRNSPDTDMLWLIVRQVSRWLNKKYNTPDHPKAVPIDPHTWTGVKNGRRSVISQTRFPEDHEIRVESAYFRSPSEDARECWAGVITERRAPQNPFAPRVWVTELGYEQIADDEAEISCVVSYSDRSGHIGPIEKPPKPTVPRFLLNIIRDAHFTCIYGCDQPAFEAISVEADGWAALWKRICDPSRIQPYICILPTGDNAGDCRYSVDPKQLAYALCGNALVFYAASPEAAGAMSEAFPPLYRCRGGGLRCYVPGCDPTVQDDSYRHRYLLPEEIESYGEQETIGILRRALVQNVDRCEEFFRIENVRRLQDKERRRQSYAAFEEQIKHNHALIEQQQERAENAEKELKTMEELLNDAITTETRAEDAEAECKKLRARVDSQQSQLDSMRSYAERGQALEEALSSRKQFSRMEKPEDVLLYFRIIYKDRLLFTENAVRSLKTCTLSTAELWSWLYAMAETMYGLFQDGEAGIEKKFKEKTGIECGRGEGSNTHKDNKLMKQYVTVYKGKEINTEMHLKSKDRLQSLHFGLYAQEKTRLLIIDHIGAHLDNSTTRKKH